MQLQLKQYNTMCLFTTLHVILLTYSIFYCVSFFPSACIFLLLWVTWVWICCCLQCSNVFYDNVILILWQISKKYFHKYGTHNENKQKNMDQKWEEWERGKTSRRYISFRWIWFFSKKKFKVTRFLQRFSAFQVNAYFAVWRHHRMHTYCVCSSVHFISKYTHAK